jgi:cytochrome c oxidase assembly protein subunit 15
MQHWTTIWSKRLALATMLGMLLILVMGALVTKTDSGKACGDTWPLCNGEFIPAYTIPSLIEYSHRIVVGIVSMILLAAAALVFIYGKRRDAKMYVIGTLVSVVLQAYLGARAALDQEQKLILALHFGISLLAFAFSLLLYVTYTRWGDFAAAFKSKRPGGLFRGLAWFTLLYSYVVVYLGAYVRHTVSSGGCSGWPLCNGEIIPSSFSGATGIVFTHRVAALLLFVLVLVLFMTARNFYRNETYLYGACKGVLLFICLQVLSGAAVTWTVSSDLYLLTGLIHAVLVACLFGILCYLCVLLSSKS